MEVSSENYSNIKKIVLKQNMMLLKLICRKNNWSYNDLSSKIFN